DAERGVREQFRHDTRKLQELFFRHSPPSSPAFVSSLRKAARSRPLKFGAKPTGRRSASQLKLRRYCAADRRNSTAIFGEVEVTLAGQMDPRVKPAGDGCGELPHSFPTGGDRKRALIRASS